MSCMLGKLFTKGINLLPLSLNIYKQTEMKVQNYSFETTYPSNFTQHEEENQTTVKMNFTNKNRWWS